MDWSNIIQNLGLLTLLMAGMAWLIRELFKGFMNRDLEKFKSELEKESISFKIRYDQLHSKRFEVIKEVYKRIVHTNRLLECLIVPEKITSEKTVAELREEFMDFGDAMMDYFDDNRIFFEKGLANEIESLFDEYRDVWKYFEISNVSKERGTQERARETMEVALVRLETKVPIVKEELESRFRNALGIED